MFLLCDLGRIPTHTVVATYVDTYIDIDCDFIDYLTNVGYIDVFLFDFYKMTLHAKSRIRFSLQLCICVTVSSIPIAVIVFCTNDSNIMFALQLYRNILYAIVNYTIIYY